MASLTHTRCFNHGHREAVARCPSCERHFCRECVTEHEHRLLCASCIASLASESSITRHRLPFRGMIQFSSAVLVLWVAFYVMGQALMLIPSTYHDRPESFMEQLQNTEPENDSDDGDGAGDEAASEIVQFGIRAS